MATPLENRYEFVYLFDVENGNPNGDPDAGNMPRIDPETNHGLVTDVCLKRKVRNYVSILAPENLNQLYKILIVEKAVLNERIEEAYEDEDVKLALDEWNKWKKNKKKMERPSKHYEDIAKEWMCKSYYDVRTFGAVLSTGSEKGGDDENNSKIRKTAGQVYGPVQINFAKSIDPITPLEISITRCAVTKVEDFEKERTMGRKQIVPYGLYRAEGYISANFAKKTGFTDDDLSLFWEALQNMFDHDHSAARGKMNARKLIVFRHDSAVGNAPAHVLFDLVGIERKPDMDSPARSFRDYTVDVNLDAVPRGVELIELL